MRCCRLTGEEGFGGVCGGGRGGWGRLRGSNDASKATTAVCGFVTKGGVQSFLLMAGFGGRAGLAGAAVAALAAETTVPVASCNRPTWSRIPSLMPSFFCFGYTRSSRGSFASLLAADRHFAGLAGALGPRSVEEDPPCVLRGKLWRYLSSPVKLGIFKI